MQERKTYVYKVSEGKVVVKDYLKMGDLLVAFMNIGDINGKLFEFNLLIHVIKTLRKKKKKKQFVDNQTHSWENAEMYIIYHVPQVIRLQFPILIELGNNQLIKRLKFVSSIQRDLN